MYINLQFHPMPPGMHGATVKNDDMGFTVFLDPNDPPDVQREGYLHEMEHIENGDFDNICDKDADMIEVNAHKKRASEE